MEQTRPLLTFFFAIALCVCVLVDISDGAAADVSTCPDSLTKLLPCLPYSQGTSKVPTSDCCKNLETIHETKPECLCELIAASVEGAPGLPKMNTTLALNLGPACKVATKPSVCPDLLGLKPDDPLNKIFTSGSSTALNQTTTPTTQGPATNAAPNAPPPENSAPLPSLSIFFSVGLVFFAYSFVIP